MYCNTRELCPAAADVCGLAVPTDPVPVVIGWLMHGLDFEAAVGQPQLPFKLRHLKAGVRLSAALLGCSAALAGRLAERGVLGRLTELSERQHMAASVRLLIVTALSAAVRWPAGLQVTGPSRHTIDSSVGGSGAQGLRDAPSGEGMPRFGVLIGTQSGTSVRACVWRVCVTE